MSDTETSQSILDNNGLLITELANEEPDQEVEDELLQSALEDEDKDIQSPTPPNEPANRLAKKSGQKSSRKRPFVRENRVSHSKERSAKIARHTRTNTRRTFRGRCKMYPTIPYNVSGHLRPSGHFDRMQPATRLCGTLTRKVSLTFIFFFFSKM